MKNLAKEIYILKKKTCDCAQAPSLVQNPVGSSGRKRNIRASGAQVEYRAREYWNVGFRALQYTTLVQIDSEFSTFAAWFLKTAE